MWPGGNRKMFSLSLLVFHLVYREDTLLKVTVDLQRSNFMIFFFFTHNIAKTLI